MFKTASHSLYNVSESSLSNYFPIQVYPLFLKHQRHEIIKVRIKFLIRFSVVHIIQPPRDSHIKDKP